MGPAKEQTSLHSLAIAFTVCTCDNTDSEEALDQKLETLVLLITEHTYLIGQNLNMLSTFLHNAVQDYMTFYQL